VAVFEKIFAQLWTEHSSTEEALHLSDDRVDGWCAELSLSPVEFYNEAGLALARAFADGTLSYEFCDDAANGLWGSFIGRSELEPFPKLFYSVYDAFDAGGYRHRDNPDADPVEAYTRPAIAAIVERYAGPAALSTARNSAP
jgi:hypothetical protein